jgi:hypothetical protein
MRLKGASKAANKSIDILERSYRPGHFYGNTVRRLHYRGTVLPDRQDRIDMVRAFKAKGPVPSHGAGRTVLVRNRYR